ncbi:MAG TPA: MmcQ/YjbR family DNA-binding protein [Tepidiformaceae bacterium]|nr:MmcQ/YjbR family DNA-binding protein [Tepidiformaceae bacterium]
MTTSFEPALRRFAQSFAGAREEFPFGPESAVAKAPNGKIFAIVSEGADGARVSLKLTPVEAEEALTIPFVRPAPYLARYHWVMATVSNDAEFEITCLWIARSFELVAAGKPARRQG